VTRMVTRDGRFRVTGKVLGDRAVLHVESLHGRATGKPSWHHVAYCHTPDGVARYLDLSQLVPEKGGGVPT
jgi:hypothetical protein